jgi:GH15 family glucan-1,4-alpha-glucosidase
MTARIEDYAMIGDCRTAALVCRDGSIDWLCVPRFDSGACFAALLGNHDNGRWLITAAGQPRITRTYRAQTMILETTFLTKTGRARLIDFMPVGAANISIVRIVEGLEGVVDMSCELVIRFDYGVSIPWVERPDGKVRTAVSGPHLLVLRTPVSLRGRDMRTVGKFKVHKGQRIPFVLAYGQSHLDPPPALDVDGALLETEGFWNQWSKGCRASPRWQERIIRSLLTAKALTYRPTGGMVAAPTASLPEQIGGPRNWDYRYCWLRDATFTLLAFLNAGFLEEANAWQHWLMRVIAGAPSQLQTMYGVAGERRLDEWTIDWLDGYEGSKPVRIGNAAAVQLQLDIFGELADAMALARRGGLPIAPRRAELRKALLDHLEKIWRQPDEGIWEIRGPAQHFTHSKAMAWVAFDRAAQSMSAPARDTRHWKEIADEIHADVCRMGIDVRRGCFVQSYGSQRLDASLLMLPLVGFLPPTDPRIVRTIEEIEKHLIFDGLVLRYQTESGVDGLPAGEGAFLACSFWLVDNYVLQGRLGAARRLFDRLAKLANDVGLMAEEYDPRGKRMLGNFPQAFSHVALVNSALNLMHADEVRKKKKPEKKQVLRHKR